MKRYTLIDTTYIRSYEDYVDNCEVNEMQPQGENSNDYWDFVSDCQRIEWDDFLLNLGHSKINTAYYWVISGSLGLWFGTRDIELVKCDTLEEAIRKCIGSCDDVIIEKEGNAVYVTGLHHDGRNHFEIRALSDLGNDRFNRHDGVISINNKENIAKLPEYLF